mgnify:CR=1 FL=1
MATNDILVHAQNLIPIKARQAREGFGTLVFTMRSDMARGWGIENGDIVTFAIVKVEKAKK